MRLMTIVVACLLVVGTVSTGGLAQARFDWRQAEGAELRVLALRAWFTDLFKERLPEFERRTGIKVIIEDFPEDPSGRSWRWSWLPPAAGLTCSTPERPMRDAGLRPRGGTRT
ncbi:MAG: hypothetical protein QN183_10325 [Armatimonadota bacterium]|nr:hypothetical protein [Armatimonadota bacterium]MDR7534237.1 hypothetical protein [Armatimonadota bacterium]MDR7536747.1 hypothetical protein [Armatimonadota bacterium]